MASYHGPSVKKIDQYEGLRKNDRSDAQFGSRRHWMHGGSLDHRSNLAWLDSVRRARRIVRIP